MSLDDILDRLHAFYGPLAEPPHDPFAMYVWEVLNFQTSPVRRDAAFSAIRRIPALTPDSIWKAVPKRLEAAVMMAGPHHDERIRALKAGADLFRRHPELPRRIAGPLLEARRALRVLPQLGLAGTQRMLLFGGSHPIIPADAHLARVVSRLGFAEPGGNVRLQLRRIRRALSAAIPPVLDRRRRTVTYLSHHGHSTCLEHDPHCHVCPLLSVCAYGEVRRQVDGLGREGTV